MAVVEGSAPFNEKGYQANKELVLSLYGEGEKRWGVECWSRRLAVALDFCAGVDGMTWEAYLAIANDPFLPVGRGIDYASATRDVILEDRERSVA